MALDPRSIEEHISAKDVSAEQVLNHKRSDVALAAAGVLGGPSIVFFGRIEAPGVAYRPLNVRKSQHLGTVTRLAAVAWASVRE